METKNNIEIEARFLEIDKGSIIVKLLDLNAKDLGEETLDEIIFYDPERKWLEQKKVVRIRTYKKGTFVTYKDTSLETINGTKEIEFEVHDVEKVQAFLESIGLKAFRKQQKKRHTFLWGGVNIDIDEYPKIPTYLEIEGPSETLVKDTARALGLNWADAHFESVKDIIEKIYMIPLSNLSVYTFEHME